MTVPATLPLGEIVVVVSDPEYLVVVTNATSFRTMTVPALLPLADTVVFVGVPEY